MPRATCGGCVGYRYDPIGALLRQYDEATGLLVDVVDKEKNTVGLLTQSAVAFSATQAVVGNSGSFSTGSKTRIQCTVGQASGTVVQATVYLRAADGTVLGTFFYPQGSARWINIPVGVTSCYFETVTLVGSSTPVLSLSAAA